MNDRQKAWRENEDKLRFSLESLLKQLLFNIPPMSRIDDRLSTRLVPPVKIPFTRTRSNFHRSWVNEHSGYEIRFESRTIAVAHHYPHRKVQILPVDGGQRERLASKLLENVLFSSFPTVKVERVLKHRSAPRTAQERLAEHLERLTTESMAWDGDSTDGTGFYNTMHNVNL